MCHLCYVYIYKYRNLSNIGLSIDPRYEYKFDPKNKKLSIEKSQNVLPENFWGEGIYSLTGIFGNNGAGKSNSIRFFLEMQIDGSGNGRSVNGIVVYEEKGEFKVYHPQDDYMEVNCSIDDIYIHPNSEHPAIDVFYYSGHFNTNFRYDDITSFQLDGSYNASIICRLFDDLEKFANINRSPYQTLSTYFECYKSQNNYRICQLLLNDKLCNKIKDIIFPKYILFAPNRGGYYHFKHNPEGNIIYKETVEELVEEPRKISLIKDDKERWLAFFIHHYLLNCIADNKHLASISYLMDKWYISLDIQKKVLPQFRELVQTRSKEERLCLDKIVVVLERLYNSVRLNKHGSFYLDFEQDKEKILDLMKSAHDKNIFSTSRYFDLYYSHEPDNGTPLSSGEQALLNLFSLIYDAVMVRRYGNKVPQLLVLDEAEIGFHPEWQRNYMSMLVDFINALSEETGHDFQILITSHSPILLSDIPLCCCNYLKIKYDKEKNEYQTENVRNSQRETFANNVFNLYRNGFFLKDGLIGRFAEGKLKQLDEDIKKGNTNEKDVKQRIKLIGDERLQMYFKNVYIESLKENPNDLIKYYEKCIDELKKNKNNNNNEQDNISKDIL